jgi:uncharacterized Tic20 family protein
MNTSSVTSQNNTQKYEPNITSTKFDTYLKWVMILAICIALITFIVCLFIGGDATILAFSIPFLLLYFFIALAVLQLIVKLILLLVKIYKKYK